MFNTIIKIFIIATLFLTSDVQYIVAENQQETIEKTIKKYYSADSVITKENKQGKKQYIVNKVIDGSLYGLMKETALDIKTVCKKLVEEKILPENSTIKFISNVGLVDKYGKNYTENAIEFTFSVRELNKVVNWNNVLPQHFLELAEDMKATPVGWEVMARQLKRDPDNYRDYVHILERMARLEK